MPTWLGIQQNKIDLPARSSDVKRVKIFCTKESLGLKLRNSNRLLMDPVRMRCKASSQTSGHRICPMSSRVPCLQGITIDASQWSLSSLAFVLVFVLMFKLCIKRNTCHAEQLASAVDAHPCCRLSGKYKLSGCIGAGSRNTENGDSATVA